MSHLLTYPFLLADKAARRVADEQTRMRIAAEVDVAMDTGVHINPE